MSNILISLIIVASLIIQKFESNVTNERLINKIQNWHLNIKRHFELVSYSDYNSISKKILSNWFLGVFILLAVINYISINLFGNDSENVLLNNHKVLYFTFFIMLLLIGNISNKNDIYRMAFLVLFSSGIIGYIIFNNYTLINSKLTIGIILVIAILFLIILFIITHYFLKLLAYIFYLLLKIYFRLCLFLNLEKPLKPFIVITELIMIISVSILSVF